MGALPARPVEQRTRVRAGWRRVDGRCDASSDLTTIGHVRARVRVRTQAGQAHDTPDGADRPGERGGAGDALQPVSVCGLVQWAPVNRGRVLPGGKGVDAGEIFLLAIHPVDRPSPAARAPHHRTLCRARANM